MFRFFVLSLVFGFASTSQVIGLGDRLWNNLWCVEWDNKPYYAYTLTHSGCAVRLKLEAVLLKGICFCW